MLISTSSAPFTSRKGIGLHGGIKLIADAGFDAIDFSLFDYDFILGNDYKKIAKDFVKLADDCGVFYNQSHAPFGGGYDYYVGHTVPNLPRVLEFAGLLGVKNIVVHPLQRGRYSGHEEELLQMNMEFYSSLAPYAKDAGVKIAIENMWQRHPVTQAICDDVCADPHELCRYYDTLDDKDAFTICLDIGHVALCQREPEDAIRVIGGDRLGCIHAHDVDYVSDLHTLPGMSKINFDNVCRALAEVNYGGEFTLETETFFKSFDDLFVPTAAKFMADATRYFAGKVEEYRVSP